jgi:PncC family amidohydrolase
MAGQMESLLYSVSLRVRNELRTTGNRLVLVESCTAGLVSAELGQIPGISEHFCGSMVVYRTASKHAWLDIEEELLEDSTIGPVSAEVTGRLAMAILRKTPEATISAGITGHLGPNAPGEMDGRVYCAVLKREATNGKPVIIRHQLRSPSPIDMEDVVGRKLRQQEAAKLLLDFIESQLVG